MCNMLLSSLLLELSRAYLYLMHICTKWISVRVHAKIASLTRDQNQLWTFWSVILLIEQNAQKLIISASYIASILNTPISNFFPIKWNTFKVFRGWRSLTNLENKRARGLPDKPLSFPAMFDQRISWDNIGAENVRCIHWWAQVSMGLNHTTIHVNILTNITTNTRHDRKQVFIMSPSHYSPLCLYYAFTEIDVYTLYISSIILNLSLGNNLKGCVNGSTSRLDL